MANVTPNFKKTTVRKPVKQNVNPEPSLKGTFVSVMLLGGFLMLSWLFVFFLFLFRN